MSIRVALHHRTHYRYERPITIYPQIVRLRPAPHCRTPILSYSLRIEPEQHFLNWQQDPHGNHLARLVFPDKARELSTTVDLIAEMTVINPFDFFLETSAEQFPFAYEPWLADELRPHLATEAPGQQLSQFLSTIPRETMRTIDFLVEVNRRVSAEIGYVIRLDPGVQSCEETLIKKRGSCRDSAWLLVHTFRNLGLAARFVSGYLIQLAPDIVPLDGPPGPTHDFCDLHAWTEVYLPGAGWVGLDPTSGLMAGEGHLPLACAPDFSGAAPITGAVEPCEAQFEFEMSVTRVQEEPRVTKPYSAEAWSAIDQLGHRVDSELERGAVRLTMGGEPTFVSVDDMEGAEWNTAALGEVKRRLAGDLLKRLRVHFAPGGLLHYGQGKWYPGEQLPRWSLSCYWRRDGQPIWQNPDLIADDQANLGHDAQTAERFVTKLAETLKVDPQCAQPAYEDAWYYLWKENRLPINVNPLDSRLDDEMERKRLTRVFDQGLTQVVGYVLPLAAESTAHDEAIWRTNPWQFRQANLFLIPGDSPIGFRLPLDSLLYAPKAERQVIIERDPLEARPELPSYENFRQPNWIHSGVPFNGAGPIVRRAMQVAQAYTPAALAEQALATLDYPATSGPASFGDPSAVHLEGNSLAGPHADAFSPNGVNYPPHEQKFPLPRQEYPRPLIRTALCVEPRAGKLHVFMPPVERAEHYLQLAAALEQTAAALGTPIVIEGYTPPHDDRLRKIGITPDPGVLEVNVQPANDWTELSHITNTIYAEARQVRLGTEKFMIDGRHTGTGGGNHVVLGGVTPADSPLLRRPDLLRSLVSFWHNHPSLSYLFSGTFVGPTSQAPRFDEARHDSLYEVEIACSQVVPGQVCSPWLVDRLFRNLLVDVTGNTHRTEFCIDKLYSPDSASGRLGLVELRGFEMPPHPQMSLVQQLLLRALVARFWKTPYTEKLVRWGTSLHDRFLLPHFVWQDLDDVIQQLGQAGFEFAPEWFAPHFEFRFPLIGSVTYRSIHLELRHAIEPWNVLGEEPAGGATARFVDSSLERLQIKVSGHTDGRYVIACNGRQVPLHPTGTVGEMVAGVRYRAWQPPQCLHPTIGVHAPLVFDVVDTWNGRSIGGCAWHVSHPGGRSYDTFPVNANEAESRRIARFFRFGHTPGPFTTPPLQVSPDFPLTLDLRRSEN